MSKTELQQAFNLVTPKNCFAKDSGLQNIAYIGILLTLRASGTPFFFGYSYSSLKDSELKALCVRHKLDVKQSYKKADLISVLMENQEKISDPRDKPPVTQSLTLGYNSLTISELENICKYGTNCLRHQKRQQ
jgi:hypothetical protein